MTIITMLTLIVLAVVTVVTIVRSIRVVPAGHVAIVERLGRYQRTVSSGLTFVIPVVDRVRTPFVDLSEQVVQHETAVVTADNHALSVSTTAHLRVVDPRAATYQVVDYRVAVDLLITTNLRNLLGDLTLSEALSSRNRVSRQLLDALSATESWGVRIKWAELADMRRPRTGLVE